MRRDVADWIMRGLTCTFESVQMFLLQSSKQQDMSWNGSANDLLCIIDEEEETIRKHYLFSVNQCVLSVFTLKLSSYLAISFVRPRYCNIFFLSGFGFDYVA